MIAIWSGTVWWNFQNKIDGLFSSMPNVFSIGDDTSLAAFNEQGNEQGSEEDETSDEVLQICR